MQVFSDAWQQREVHPQLLKLLSMWEGIFPPQLLNVLKQRTQQSRPAQHMSHRPAGPSTSHQTDPRAVPRQQPALSGPGTLPGTSGSNGYYAGPHSAHTAAVPFQTAQPLQQPGLQHGYVNAAPQAWPVAGQMLPRPAYAVHQQAAQQPSSQPLVLPNLLSSLLSSGLLTVPPSVSIAHVGQLPAAPAVSYSQPSSRAGTPEAMSPDGSKFISSRLKVLSWSLIISWPLAFCEVAVPVASLLLQEISA